MNEILVKILEAIEIMFICETIYCIWILKKVFELIYVFKVAITKLNYET